jgi:uncharacterized membrane protein
VIDSTEQLVLTAQLGATFAGLLSIFLIFARREGRFSPADSLRVSSIVFSSFFVVFFALLPLVLQLYGLNAGAIWQAAGALACLAAIPIGVNVARRQVALRAAERAKVGRLHSAVSWSLFAAAAVLMVVDALGLHPELAAALYVTALGCGLGIATSNFLTIAFQRLL